MISYVRIPALELLNVIKKKPVKESLLDNSKMVQDPGYVPNVSKFPIEVLLIFNRLLKMHVAWHFHRRR